MSLLGGRGSEKLLNFHHLQMMKNMEGGGYFKCILFAYGLSFFGFPYALNWYICFYQMVSHVKCESVSHWIFWKSGKCEQILYKCYWYCCFCLAKVQAIECYDVLFPCVDDNTTEMVSDPYSTEKPIVSEKLFRNSLMFEEELSIGCS